jgi:hypothetical protein
MNSSSGINDDLHARRHKPPTVKVGQDGTPIEALTQRGRDRLP